MSQQMRIIRALIGREGMTDHRRRLPRWTGATFLVAVLTAPLVGHAEPIPLRFRSFAPGVNITNMNEELGPGYTGGLTMRFLNVGTWQGTTIDACVTAVVQPDTEFATGTTNRTARGYLPNYKATLRAHPRGDLGILYAGTRRQAAGVTVTISFFDGTGERSGAFSEVYVVPDLQLLVYDVDGEPAQTEWFEALLADGLASYATGSAPAQVEVTPTATGVQFQGPGRNFEETDTSGAVLLRYRNTSRVTLAFGAEQHQDGTNPVFVAIDGDMSLQVTGAFQAPTAVPDAVPLAPPDRPAPVSASRSYAADNVIRLDRLTPAAVAINVPFDYTLKVTNVTETVVQDVVVRENLPTSFQLHSSDPQARKEGEDLCWTIGSLDPKASREIKVSGVATTVDNLKPCATVTFRVPPFCADIAVLEPKLTLTQTAAKEVLVGDPIELQLVVANPGTGPVEGVQIVTTLPAGLQTTEGKTELVFNVGTLAPGQSRQLAGLLKAAQTGQYVAKALASAQGGLKAEATTTTIVRQPVLAISKTGPARQYIGRPTTYEITVTNKGDAPAANTVLEDTIPPGAQRVQTSPAGTISGPKVVWQLGTLAVNASKKVSITYTPIGAKVVAQAATASAVGADPVSATARTEIFGIAAMLLEVVDTEDPVLVGGQTTYLITATNQGSSPSTNVQITALIEEAEEIVATEGPTPATVEGRTVRFLPLASLAPKAKATWQVTVKARKPGDVRFRATMITGELGRDVEETEATQLYE